jgi:multicomponent Na+:H+ antiporter subunit F
MNTFIALLICVLGVGIMLCFYRVLIGPTLAERTVAADGLVFMVMGILILVSIYRETDMYLTAVLVIALLAFISTLTVSRYLELTQDE